MDTDREERIRRRAYQIWQDEGAPEGRAEDHWEQARREIDRSDGEVEGDEVPNLEALREAARQHNDGFLVKTDLEDANQREAAPGTREQP